MKLGSLDSCLLSLTGGPHKADRLVESGHFKELDKILELVSGAWCTDYKHQLKMAMVSQPVRR